MKKFLLIIVLLSFIISVKAEQQKIYLSPEIKETFNLSSSITYLFIIEAKARLMGKLVLMFDQRLYYGYPKYINIYQYSNKNYTYYNCKNTVKAIPSYYDKETHILYSFRDIESTTNYLGYEIKLDTDMKNVTVIGYKIKYLREDDNTDIYYLILSFFCSFIIMCIAIIVILCCCRKRNRAYIQPQITQTLSPESQNQPLSQYNNSLN